MRAGLIGVSGLVMAALAGLGGCSSTPAQQQLDTVRDNPSPEMMTLTQTPDEVWNQISITNNTNMREFWGDLGRFWLLDRPSHLAPEPVR